MRVAPGVDLYVEDLAGPEPALLVVHGGPDWDHTYLLDPLARLAGERRVLLPDLRGCGRSTRGLPVGAYSWPAAAADLLALLDGYGLARVDVLGFSVGGALAQRLAAAAPDRVRRLVLASASIGPAADAYAGWAERDRRLAAAPPIEAGLTGPALVEAWARSSAALDVWRPELLPDYRRRLDAIRWSGEWLAPYEAGLLGPARPHDAQARLAATGIPVLLLHGRQDMTFPVSVTEAAAAGAATMTAWVLEDAGHMAHVDQPERWLSAVRGFLDGPVPGSGSG
ncbi:MAG TPA: alpha/beta hydrolase [Mycobacteriales bacterium]|nr:alpha/beta hydrolase [Mycobacteriales bacterium]